ncbi:MAG: hypothetical protein IKP88_02710 [Lachnospiraceae bacterium]|nr:hypothetical protein [Lachnospiraceae bacterium]
MIECKRKISYDNRGSALIMALVVSAVLMVLSLSLLAVSYSLFLSEKNNTGGSNERELFYSAIEVFEQELISGGHKDLSEITVEGASELYKDEDTFGTQIVDSIFNYCNREKPEALVAGIKEWPCYDPTDTSKDADTAIKESSRFFDLTCLGSYEVSIQMYWEKDNTSDGSNTVNGVLLHVIYFLKKVEETVLKTERIYRLETVAESATKPKQDQRQGKKIIKFALSTETKNENYFVGKSDKYYKVDPEFLPGGEKGIKITEDEFNDETFNIYNLFPGVNVEGWWHTGSKLSETPPWDGSPKMLCGETFDTSTVSMARTNWDHKVPVRIKFIVNGYLLDLNIYEYRYTKFIKPEEEDIYGQVFNKDKLNGVISKKLLEVCGVDAADIGDDYLSNITWVIKDVNDYYDFFFDGINPKINKNYQTMEKTYVVYATFPSYYNSFGKLDESKLPTVNGKSIDPANIYMKYSFERVIGGE